MKADETSEVLKIPRQYHPSLIGQSGKYVIRLEEKYDVKITFPRDNGEGAESKNRDQPLKPDEVVVKGGKKGVAQAKAELLDVSHLVNLHQLTLNCPLVIIGTGIREGVQPCCQVHCSNSQCRTYPWQRWCIYQRDQGYDRGPN